MNKTDVNIDDVPQVVEPTRERTPKTTELPMEQLAEVVGGTNGTALYRISHPKGSPQVQANP